MSIDKEKDWDINTQWFEAIRAESYETDLDIFHKVRSVEENIIIIDTYQSLSEEAKHFIKILFVAPMEFFDILNGKEVQMRKNKGRNLNKFIRGLFKPTHYGRESKKIKAQIESIKSELKEFTKLL